MKTLFLAVLAVLAAAAPASAAVTPKFLGTGHDPGVAVDRAGTAHVAWFTEGPEGTGTLEYCQVRRRPRTCTLRRTLPLVDEGAAKAQVLVPRPGTVHIIVPVVNGDTLLFSSGDGGNTFAPPVSLRDTGTVETALIDRDGLLSMVSQTGPAAYGRYGFDGAGPETMPVVFGSATESLDTSLAPLGRGLIVFFAGLAGRSVIWNGVGDPNLQQSWFEGRRLGDGRTAPSAAGGPKRTFVAYVDRSGSRSDIRVRRVRSSGRFGRAKRISRDAPVDVHLVRSRRGSLAAIWDDGSDVFYVRSRNGRRWTRPKVLVRGNDPADLRPALGRRGGWVVWDSSAGNFGMYPIRIARIP
jgi:hypothetical protein